MKFVITPRESDGALVLDVTGRLVLGDPADELRNTTRRLLDDGHRAFVMHLAGVSYMDSSGLGHLVAAAVSVRSRCGHVVVLNPSPRVIRLLRLSRVGPILGVYTDEAEAVAAVTTQVQPITRQAYADTRRR